MKSFLMSVLSLFCFCIIFCSCEDKYAIKTVCELSNGNFIIKQLIPQKDYELFGIKNPSDSIIVSPQYTSISVDPKESSVLIAELGIDGFRLLKVDGSILFDTSRDNGFSLRDYTYDESSKLFILKYRTLDSDNNWHTSFRIGNLKGDILYDAGQCHDLIFAKGLDMAYILHNRLGFEIIDINGNPYESSEYNFVGGYGISKNEPSFINLFNGEKHKYNQFVDGNYIEYKDGVINLSNNEIIVKYIEYNETDTTENKEILEKQGLWVKRKYVRPNQDDCIPYKLSKIIDNIPFYTANFMGINIPTLYRPNDSGDMSVSAYNLKTIVDVIDYINETGMYTKDYFEKEQPILIKSNMNGRDSLKFDSNESFIKYCKINPNGEYAFFALDRKDCQFRFSTENFENVSYEINVPAGMEAHLPYMTSLEPFTNKVTSAIDTKKKRTYRPWMYKIWIDCEYAYLFDIYNVYIMKNGKFFTSVKYNYDPLSPATISFEFDDQESSAEYPTEFISLLPSFDETGKLDLYHEGGNGVELLNVDVCDFGVSTPKDITSNLEGRNEGNTVEEGIKGYEWLEGEWEHYEENEFGSISFGKVVITKNTFKYVTCNNNSNLEEISTAEEHPISIGYYDNYIVERKILSLDEKNFIIDIDKENKQIYMILGEYSRILLKKKN